MRDAPAEAAVRRPLGVGVLWMHVAGQRREAAHVGPVDRARRGRETLADRQRVEVLGEGHAVTCLSRSRARTARTKAAAARRYPSCERWNPSSAYVSRSSAAGSSEPSSKAMP